MKLSVIIITRNEAVNIRACLDSVRFADEIIVVDSESTDETPAICRELGAVVLTVPFRGYGHQKNRALDQAHGEWVLSVDADERVPFPLRDEILAVTNREVSFLFDNPEDFGRRSLAIAGIYALLNHKFRFRKCRKRNPLSTKIASDSPSSSSE